MSSRALCWTSCKGTHCQA